MVPAISPTVRLPRKLPFGVMHFVVRISVAFRSTEINNFFILNPIAVTGAFGVPCLETRKVPEDDSGETASTVSLRGFQ